SELLGAVSFNFYGVWDSFQVCSCKLFHILSALMVRAAARAVSLKSTGFFDELSVRKAVCSGL
ncbi:MAG TPA: hypothetical protein P5522_13655, partial [Spirochaetia bacterium]|nr:hypothetical protein [Spirochaetia bacterium]